MAHDLLIRNAIICDGTGASMRHGALAVKDGRIVAVGDVGGPARREIDAGGAVLAPGFIDIHTHYDAQISWDPLLTCSCWHGVTTVITGNCGVGVAPCRPGQQSTMAWDLVNVEALPHEVLMRGVTWEWESFAQDMAAIERRGVGLNVGFLVPLSALRFYVIGDEAAERAATDAETAEMAQLLGEALRAGASGFSLSLAPQHIGFQGRPLASRLASDDELRALCRAMRELGRGMIEILPNRGSTSVADEAGLALLKMLARESGRPVTWLALLDLPGTPPDAHRRTIERLAPLVRSGLTILPQVTPRPIQQYYTMREPFIFAALDSWKAVFNRPAEEQMALLGAPAFRDAFRREIANGGGNAIFRGRWDRVHIARVQSEHNRRFLNLSVADLAQTTGKDAVDALLDLALDERMQLGVTLSVINVNPDVVSDILKLPNTLIGLSDAGAHVAQHCDAGLTSYLLHEWVKRRGLLTLEEAVRRLTSELADFLQLPAKGRLAPGMDADLVIFDPSSVRPLAPEWVNDLPGGEPRLVERAEGIEYTIVGGEILFVRDQYQGGLPGKVMRADAGA